MLHVDISHIARSNGRMTGIERVEYRIIDYYLTTAIFVNWDDIQKKFVVVNQKDVQALLDKLVLGGHTPISSSRSVITKITNKIGGARNSKSRTGAIFNEQDTLLILDGLWDREDYILGVIDASAKCNLNHIVYDMVPALFPGYVLEFMHTCFVSYMKRVLPLCKKIFAISESTASDTRSLIAEWCNNLVEVSSFRLGDDSVNGKKMSINHGGLPAGKFVLSTGTLEVRKNLMIYIYAYIYAREKKIDLPRLILVGKRGWLSGDFQYIVENDPYLKSKITIMSDVADDMLSAMYEKSLYTICASFYEGWGLPVAESLSYGKVTLSARNSSLVEAGSNLADYFTTSSAEELVALMHKYNNSKIRQERELYIRSHFVSVSWKQSVKLLNDLIIA